MVLLLSVGWWGCHPARLVETRPWLGPKVSEFDLLEKAPAERHLLYGLAYESQGELREALRHYQRASRSESSIAEAYLGMCRIHFLRGRSRKACAAGRKALNLSPSLYVDLNDFLWNQASLRRPPAMAVRLAHWVVEMAGEDRAHCLDTLAFIRIQRGELAEAEIALDEAEKGAERDPVLKAWILHHRAAIAEQRGVARQE